MLERYCEVSPDWLRYELPKLGIAGSNPALRTELFSDDDNEITNSFFSCLYSRAIFVCS
jgi:hypothetical protein